MYFDSSLKL
jgi:ribonuclease HI